MIKKWFSDFCVSWKWLSNIFRIVNFRSLRNMRIFLSVPDESIGSKRCIKMIFEIHKSENSVDIRLFHTFTEKFRHLQKLHI